VFATITLGFGESVYAAALMLPQVFGGEAGVAANRTLAPAWWGLTFASALQVYYLVAAYAMVSAAALYWLGLTPWGACSMPCATTPSARPAWALIPTGCATWRSWWRLLGVAGALGAIHF